MTDGLHTALSMAAVNSALPLVEPIDYSWRTAVHSASSKLISLNLILRKKKKRKEKEITGKKFPKLRLSQLQNKRPQFS